jgi:hypothetical protein
MAWKRTICFGSIVVVVSVLLNVVVAWTAAMAIDVDALAEVEVHFKRGFTESSPMVHGRSALTTWTVATRRGFATMQVHASMNVYQGIDEDFLDCSEEHPRTGLPAWVDPYIKVIESKSRYCVGYGWPAVGLVTDQRRDMVLPPTGTRITGPPPETLGEAMTGWVIQSLPWPSGEPRVLPTRIIWSGLLTNAALYAVILSLPFVLRWTHRRWRGHCIVCGYDLQKNYAAGCPECGWRRTHMSGGS